MSGPNTKIITDKVLLDIIKAATQSELRKHAANPPTIQGIAKKLVNKLTREFSGKKEMPSITTDLPESNGINPTNLGSIDKLIQFLMNDQIKVNGQRVAYSEKEYEQLSEDIKNKLSLFTNNVTRTVATGHWNDDNFWVDNNSLKEYISYLQQKADTMQHTENNPEGKLLQVQVGKLVDELNTRVFPNSGLTRKTKGTPEQPNELPDETLIDSFSPNKILNRNDAGSTGLYAKNLKSKEALNEWLLGGGEWGNAANIVSGNKLIPYTDTDESVNQCAMISALYNRAKNKLEFSKNTELTKNLTYYVNKIKELGPSFTGPDGKACAIGSSNQGLPSPAPSPGVTPGSNPKSNTNIHTLAQALPLDNNDIDFHRIRYFFNSYKQLLANSQNPRVAEINASMAQAEQAMENAAALTKSGNQSINLFVDPISIVNMLQPPAAIRYVSFIQLLEVVIQNTASVIGNLYAQYKETFSSSERNAIEEQVIGSNSIFKDNGYKLQQLLAGREQATRLS